MGKWKNQEVKCVKILTYVRNLIFKYIIIQICKSIKI